MPSANAKVCSDHFKSEHYQIGLKYKTLKPDAIPIVYTSEKEKAKAEAKVTRSTIASITTKSISH